MKKLFITEKPSVAMEYAKILGVTGRKKGYYENSEYVITWCVGHLVGLIYPEGYDSKYKKWNIDDLPFIPDKYKYDVINSVKEQYAVVKKLLHSKEVEIVYWAGDSAREGQVIEENIRMLSGVRNGIKELRIWIDSQTEEEIIRGIREAKPMSEYQNLGSAGIMRAIEDFAVGINFSRALSCKYANLVNEKVKTKKYTPISVGRVMTCVLGMVVDRENEIRKFSPMTFYKLTGNYSGVSLEWYYNDNSCITDKKKLYKDNSFLDINDAKSVKDRILNKNAVIENIKIVTSKKAAPLLFNLAELQSECTKQFKISPDETLKIVQELYEKKYVTYPRTDARVLSSAVSKEIIKNIKGLINCDEISEYVKNIIDSKSYLGIEKSKYVDDAKISDHYAIIPTGVLPDVSNINELQKSVYMLIVKRFISIFMDAATYSSTEIRVNIENELLLNNSKVLTSPGYLVLYNKKEEINSCNSIHSFLSNYKKGDSFKLEEISITEGKTTPPKRYTSGSMILAMENAGQLIEEEELREQIKGSGIGTSATRAEIVKKLVNIEYLLLDKKTQVLSPSILGEMIYKVVLNTVPSMLQPRMTASWEKGLKSIEDGSVTPEEYQEKLYNYIIKEISNIKNNDIGNLL